MNYLEFFGKFPVKVDLFLVLIFLLKLIWNLILKFRLCFLKVLLDYLRADVSSDCPTQKLLNFVLVDTKNGQYTDNLSQSLLHELDIQLIDTKLVSKQSAPYYDPELLVAALLSLTWMNNTLASYSAA